MFPPSAWQFNLRQLLGAMALLGLLAWLFARFYLFGVVVGILMLGIVVGFLGSFRKDSIQRTAGWGAAILSFLILCCGGWEGIGDGQTTFMLSFIVVDSSTSKPISGAAVRLRELNADRGLPTACIPTGEPGVEGKTDTTGHCQLSYRFKFSEHLGPLIRHRTHIYFGRMNYWVQVQAPGFQTGLIPLDELMGTLYERTSKEPLPTRQLLLKQNRQSPHP